MQWLAHQDHRHAFLGDKSGELGEIGADVRALQSFEALRGDAQRIAERQADALLAQIQCENTSETALLIAVIHDSIPL